MESDRNERNRSYGASQFLENTLERISEIVVENIHQATYGKCDKWRKQQDFIEALQVWNEPVDVIWIGLSLHHLQGSGKLAVMQNVRRLVGTAGWFLIYENASPDGENRDAWLERWDEQRSAWTAYSTAEWDYVTAHVHAADFPETNSRWHELGREAGFSSVQELFVSPTDLFRLYAFSNYQKS